MADWVTISALASAGGTLVLAGATFASIKSANRAARVAERSLLANLRPLLLPSKLDDPPQKVGFSDDRWFMVPGGQGMADVSPEAVYLVMALRNVGNGIAVLHGWRFYPERQLGGDAQPTPVDGFTRLTRDLYVPVGDVGFWQGAFRDPAAPEFAEAAAAISARQPMTIDLLYGDNEGGQRVISRYSLNPRQEEGWYVSAGRHWNVDRDDPR
ncbi:MAG TPA: hypothetical protein VLJ76_05935 [Gaiellaceae bacterium]|nr:hypothetical protein [Gaiellaceae bacterium]